MGYNLAVSDTGVPFSIGGRTTLAGHSGTIIGIELVDASHARLTVLVGKYLTQGQPIASKNLTTIVIRVANAATDVLEIPSLWYQWPYSHEAPWVRT